MCTSGWGRWGKTLSSLCYLLPGYPVYYWGYRYILFSFISFLKSGLHFYQESLISVLCGTEDIYCTHLKFQYKSCKSWGVFPSIFAATNLISCFSFIFFEKAVRDTVTNICVFKSKRIEETSVNVGYRTPALTCWAENPDVYVGAGKRTGLLERLA